MSKQMHQIDDDENPGSGIFWHQEQSIGKPSPQTAPGTPPEILASGGGSGQENHGMGNSNPFENWRVKQESEKQATLPTSHKKSAKSAFNVIWQAISSVVMAGVVVATLFSLWMPGSAISGSLALNLAEDEGLTLTEIAEGVLPDDFPTNKIGIVVGHRGHDSGAVCSNGLTELEINSNVATYVQQKLIAVGFEVELLDEFDSRLKNYQAGLLLSIHSDSCDYINDSATGFKVAAAYSQLADKSSTRLVQCLSDRYAKITGLRYHYQSVTTDMTDYHAFGEINPYTTAGIIEIGFMNLDQEILTTRPELLAEGIAEGISCYMNNEEIKEP
ncbi:MAG: N-acetylmuramoyl-L-alanine amidase [Chloroflexi bacterium]|jgi:N-acetylmuramoyl-L-alanine amidase|nr:N-acetylmuramoyl-L-alanine amidase [Chloroflexota bacterium]